MMGGVGLRRLRSTPKFASPSLSQCFPLPLDPDEHVLQLPGRRDAASKQANSVDYRAYTSTLDLPSRRLMLR